jgi:hypothetical protein
MRTAESEYETVYSFKDESAAEVWLAYAQTRFGDASKRIDDYRSWARQLVVAIGVMIGLEANVYPKLIEALMRVGQSWAARMAGPTLGSIIGAQLVLLSIAGVAGFVGTRLRSPENPRELAPKVVDFDSKHMTEVLAGYFTAAYGRYHSRAQFLSMLLGWTTWFLIATVVLFGCGVALCFCFARRIGSI